MLAQTVVTAGLILLASLIIFQRARRLIRGIMGQRSTGQSCGGCSGCRSAAPTPTVVQLSLAPQTNPGETGSPRT